MMLVLYIDYIETTADGYSSQTIKITDINAGNVLVSVPFTNPTGTNWYSSTITKDISSINNVYDIKITSADTAKYTYMYEVYIYYKH